MSEFRRSARLELLRDLLETGQYSSQQELADALAVRDIAVSQPTLSKDLLALGAIKRRTIDGSLVYALGEAGDDGGAATERLARLCSEVLRTIQSAGNQIIIKTPPGAAQFLASHLDAARLAGVMGTIAGDDTVLVICTDDAAAATVAGMIAHMTRTGKPAQPEGEGFD